MQEHLNKMRELGFNEEQINAVENNSESDPVPLQSMSYFMMSSWGSIADPNMQAGWLSRTHSCLKLEKIDRNRGHLGFWDESEEPWNAAEKAVGKLLTQGVDESALLTVLRYCQGSTLGHIVKHIDGGSTASVYEAAFEDGEQVGKRKFADMFDLIYQYDPALKNM